MLAWALELASMELVCKLGARVAEYHVSVNYSFGHENLLEVDLHTPLHLHNARQIPEIRKLSSQTPGPRLDLDEVRAKPRQP